MRGGSLGLRVQDHFEGKRSCDLQLKFKVPCEMLLIFIFGIHITYALFGTDSSDRKTTMLTFYFILFSSPARVHL